MLKGNLPLLVKCKLFYFIIISQTLSHSYLPSNSFTLINNAVTNLNIILSTLSQILVILNRNRSNKIIKIQLLYLKNKKYFGKVKLNSLKI